MHKSQKPMLLATEDQSFNQSGSFDAVQFVNHLLLKAVQQGASDIHFEPYKEEYRIRLRQDGILQAIAAPDIQFAPRVTAHIKVLSNLDISERRLPQDGGFKISTSTKHSIDLRVSTCPIASGAEKVVIRILDPTQAQFCIEKLGLSSLQEKQFIQAIKRPQGLILVTGPTGSGKTVTLYTALNFLNTPDVNIATAEDPVEIQIKGLNQVHINPKVGLNFSETLRSFLRQDPDIIMLGEIRDLETAEIAVKAAQTGHLVLSTLHTNSASETLNRLLDMGVPSFNLASSLSLIVAQRLVRRLCEHCKELRKEHSEQALLQWGFSPEQIQDVKLYKAVGCTQCIKGYKGRLGLFEVLPMTKPMSELVLSGGNALDILNQARAEGMRTIYQTGLDRIKEGITTIEELNRVTVDSV